MHKHHKNQLMVAIDKKSSYHIHSILVYILYCIVGMVDVGITAYHEWMDICVYVQTQVHDMIASCGACFMFLLLQTQGHELSNYSYYI